MAKNTVGKPSALEVLREYGVMETCGRKYKVAGITLEDLMDGDELNQKQPGVSYDADRPGQLVFINLQIPASREIIKRYIEKYLTCGGAEMSLAKCREHGWNVDDLGTFLQVLYRVSG